VHEGHIEELIERPPPGVDPEDWDSLSKGDRLRVLKKAHYLFALDEEDRLAIRQVPSWASFGAEDGVPADWFNPDGFLLPKYRPGGGRYAFLSGAVFLGGRKVLPRMARYLFVRCAVSRVVRSRLTV